MLEEIALVLIGAALTLAAQYIRNLSDRDTHASNRVLEIRLNALQSIWEKYAAALWVLGSRTNEGWEHYDEAKALQDEFRREVERNQIVLDHSVVAGLRRIDSDLLLFRDGDWHTEQGRPIGFARFRREHLDPHLDELAAAINRTMDVSTHKINLRFKEAA